MLDAKLWFRSFRSEQPAVINLVCLPHAGGSANFFRALAAELSPQINVLAVQYPGRMDRVNERFITNAHDLADIITEGLLSYAGPPFMLFGHSMGALIAFEVARRLDRVSDEMLGLFVSGRGEPADAHGPRIYHDNDASLLKELARLGGSDPRLFTNRDLQRIFLPAVRADFQMIANYSFKPAEPLRCAVTAMVGDADPTTTIEAASGWNAHTSGDFQLCVFPGHHFYLTECITEVAEVIAETIPAWQRENLEVPDHPALWVPWSR